MRVSELGDRLVVSSTPGCLWLFGLWFVAGGALAVFATCFATNAHELSWWARLAALGVGVAALAAGVFIVAQAPAVRTELDRAADRGVVISRALGRAARVEEFRCSDVRGLEVHEARDGDGDATFQLRLWLRDGRVVALHGNVSYGREWVEARAAPIRRFLGLPT